MYEDKINTALSTTLKHLTDSLKALSEGKSKALSDSMWSALLESEYAVFVLSLTQGEEAENAPWKKTSAATQKVELEPALTSAMELLKNAKKELKSSRLENAYEKAWKARNLILDTQGLADEKRRETKK
jgi:hypothetical protein